MQLKIIFSAEGKRSNGCVCTVSEFCGSAFDSIVVDSERWWSAAREQDAILLGIVRQRYPEANWTRVNVIEYKSV